MPNIDVPVNADLHKLFDLPPCDMVSIPLPKPLKVTLPTGGSIKSISDISKGIPTDCAMTFSLMVQIAPILASTECLMKVLKLLKPLIDVIKGLPMPPVKAIQEFAKAAADLAPCLLAPTPAMMIPFVKDLLCLILKFLKCFLSQMKSLVAIMNGIQLQMPQAGENDELRNALQCAQENAERQAQHLTTAIEPIGVILDLAGAFFEIAGVPAITIPTMPAGTDVTALNNVIQSVQAVVATVQIAADALGGCD